MGCLVSEPGPAGTSRPARWPRLPRGADQTRTSTRWAPWYVVPADHKWFSRLATAAVLVTALRAINPGYPPADPAEREEMIKVRAELAAEPGLAQPG
jgi:hypothetical protein